MPRWRKNCWRRPNRQLVAIGGLSGTGKSVLARALAPELLPLPGAVVLRSDVERKALFGVGETERLPEAAYPRETTAKVYAALAEKARRVTAAGHSAIVDAVFATPVERDRRSRKPQTAPRSTAYSSPPVSRPVLTRVGGRSGDASDADADVARKQEEFDLGRIDMGEGRRIRHSGGNAPACRRRCLASDE